MQLELPVFEDPAIDEVLAGLPSPAAISIRGISGSGKTIFAEHLVAAALTANQVSRVVLLGEEDIGREVLNQATGVGIELLPELPTGRLAVDVLQAPTLREVCHSLTHYPQVDVVVIDSLEEVPDADIDYLDRLFSWIATEADTSIITIGEAGGKDSRPFADLIVNFEQLSGEEDFWYADSVLTIETPTKDIPEIRAFRIEGYSIQMWEAT